MPERSPAPLRTNVRHRLTRQALRRPALRAGLALALTAPVVAAGVAATSVEDGVDNAQSVLAAATGTTEDGAAAFVDLTAIAERADRVSRSNRRTMPAVTLKPRAVDRLWATAPLNLWTGPGEHTRRVGLVEERTRVAVTGQREGRWAEVLVAGGKDRWVNAAYLSPTKPKPEPEPSSAAGASSTSGSTGVAGISTAPCPDGSSIESGTTPNADMLYRAVCNAFPSLSSYGGYDPHGEHIDGRAYDFMASGAFGSAIAEYVRANASALNVRTIIYAQRIWTPERAGEGWRYMSDRGSATANHYDHVHVSVY